MRMLLNFTAERYNYTYYHPTPLAFKYTVQGNQVVRGYTRIRSEITDNRAYICKNRIFIETSIYVSQNTSNRLKSKHNHNIRCSRVAN